MPQSAPSVTGEPVQGSQAALAKPIKIVGCGSCGVDYLASVAAFPHPDQKLRTDTLEVGKHSQAWSAFANETDCADMLSLVYAVERAEVVHHAG